MPSSACLPLAASGPVSAMEKPILMGSCALAVANGPTIAASAIAAPAIPPSRHRLRCLLIVLLPKSRFELADTLLANTLIEKSSRGQGWPASRPARHHPRARKGAGAGQR